MVKILFKFDDMEKISKEVYRGGRISWDVIRWGKCPGGTEAIRVQLTKGCFRDHFIVFDHPDAVISELKNRGLDVTI